MNGRPQVRDIRSYLLGGGWTHHEETWRGASIWSNVDGREVLVPANDELADTGLRITEILAVLTEAEERPASEIVTDIVTPLVDIQSYRIPVQEGFFSLPAGLHTLQGARTLITVAARTVVHGPLPVSYGSCRSLVRHEAHCYIAREAGRDERRLSLDLRDSSKSA